MPKLVQWLAFAACWAAANEPFSAAASFCPPTMGTELIKAACTVVAGCSRRCFARSPGDRLRRPQPQRRRECQPLEQRAFGRHPAHAASSAGKRTDWHEPGCARCHAPSHVLTRAKEIPRKVWLVGVTRRTLDNRSRSRQALSNIDRNHAFTAGGTAARVLLTDTPSGSYLTGSVCALSRTASQPAARDHRDAGLARGVQRCCHLECRAVRP